MARAQAARWRPSTWPRPVRRVCTALSVLVIILAMSATAYRTLRPAETVSRATRPLPSPEPVQAIQYGELQSTPLIVEGRLRVYAEQRRVFADTPVTARREMTPHWAYRRWPAELVAVVAVERLPLPVTPPGSPAPLAPTAPATPSAQANPSTGPQPNPSLSGSPTGTTRSPTDSSVVIAKWSDGVVVALDAETGGTIWQQRVEPADGETYQGRRTGAQTVYQPDSLFLSASAVDGRPVIIATGRGQVAAFDPWTGGQRWNATFAGQPDCRQIDWTGPTTYFVKDTCVAPALLEVYDAGSGTLLSQWRPPGASDGPPTIANWYSEPASCELGRSRCQLFKAAPTGEVVTFADKASNLDKITPSYFSTSTAGLITLETLADKDVVMVHGDRLMQQVATDYIWAYSRSTGQRLWMSEVAGQLVAVDAQHVYIVNREFQLLVLDAVTGAVTSSTELRIRPDDRWVFKHAYVHGGFMVVERLGSGRESDVDERYYFSSFTAVLVGIE